MNRVFISLAACLLTLFPAAASEFRPGMSWDWQLGDRLKLSRDVEVFDLDPDSVSRQQISALKKRGILTICYVSVGTIENYRDDITSFPPGVVGKTYGDWPDEKFLDIRRRDILLPLMEARFKKCRALGFDAIEPDNMDVYDNESGFPISRKQNVTYIRALARIAHRLGLGFAQKNVPELTGSLVGFSDFAITESCFQDGWCKAVAGPYIKRGKPVFDAEYTDRPLDFDAACQTAAQLGLSMIVKNRNLGSRYKACPAAR